MAFIFLAFVLSFAGIATLFFLKHRELATGKSAIPDVRMRLDARAFRIKELARAAQADLKRVPPMLLHLTRVWVHQAALRVARFARYAESQAHRLADLASYKHRFERRETRSEFLQKIMDHKKGNGVETNDDSVQSTEAKE